MQSFNSLTSAEQQTIVQAVARAMELVRIRLDDEDRLAGTIEEYTDSEVARRVRAQAVFNLQQAIDPDSHCLVLPVAVFYMVDEYIHSLRM